MTWTCKAIPTGATSADFQYLFNVFRIAICATTPVLVLLRPPPQTIRLDHSETVVSLRPRILRASARSSYLSARASSRLFLAVELALDASLTASLA